jgi:hypothetical protein
VLPLSCKHFMPTSSRVHQKANQQTHSIPPMCFYIVPKSCCLSRVQIAFFSVYGSQLCEWFSNTCVCISTAQFLYSVEGTTQMLNACIDEAIIIVKFWKIVNEDEYIWSG